jgi:hypothetical protein
MVMERRGLIGYQMESQIHSWLRMAVNITEQRGIPETGLPRCLNLRAAISVTPRIIMNVVFADNGWHAPHTL